MRELTKSVTSFTWAMSLFGAKQMLNLAQPAKAAAAFDSVAEATGGQLDESLRSAFEAGDRLQRSMIDATFSLMSMGGALDPGRVVDRAGAAMEGTNPSREPDPGTTRSQAGASPAGAHHPGWGPVPG